MEDGGWRMEDGGWGGRRTVPEKTEGAEHRESRHPLRKQLHQGECHDEEVETVPSVLRQEGVRQAGWRRESHFWGAGGHSQAYGQISLLFS